MDTLLDRVVKTLSPYLGQVAARASVKMFLERSGLPPDSVRPEHLGQLAETLKPGLRVFVGPAKTDAVVGEILDLGKGA